MGKKKVIVIGYGSRGKRYTDIMADEFPDDFEIVAVAEPIEDRRSYMQKKYGIPDERCFESWEGLLAMPKFADVAVIATMDRDHYAPAMAAIERGYDLLLEKPVAPTPEQCREIQHAAEKKGVFVLVCHVLRFTKFFMKLKELIDTGAIGRVMNIQHVEGVGNIHHSHSFVRGKWGNSDKSSCMILQKSCHDMDILAWLIGKKCVSVQSFGSLSYFTRENAPKDAPEYCIEGCPNGDTCPYNAVKLYPNSDSDWFRCACTKKIAPTDEEVVEAIKTTQYGKCVFKCDNNVVDHQVVNLRFEDGVYADFTMSAFNRGGRVIRIMGTKGEITAAMDGEIIDVYSFETQKTERVDFNAPSNVESIDGGHGGGDNGIIYALRELLNGRRVSSVCDISESCDNHMIAFAAEEARLTGKVVEIKDFEKEIEGR